MLILTYLISRNLATCLMTEEMSHQAKDDVFVVELNNHFTPLAMWPHNSFSVSAASLRHIGFQIHFLRSVCSFTNIITETFTNILLLPVSVMSLLNIMEAI
jgi:hypothetical protein